MVKARPWSRPCTTSDLSALAIRCSATITWCSDCIGRSVPWPAILHASHPGDRQATAGQQRQRSHITGKVLVNSVDVYVALSQFNRLLFCRAGFAAHVKHPRSPKLRSRTRVQGLANEPARCSSAAYLKGNIDAAKQHGSEFGSSCRSRILGDGRSATQSGIGARSLVGRLPGWAGGAAAKWMRSLGQRAS